MTPIITLAVLCFLAAAEATFSNGDRQVLLSFYDSQPSKAFTWDFSSSLCGQTGVTCTDGAEGQFHVEGLDLSGQGLTGTFPESFAKFRYLRILDLTNNELSGSFPSSNLHQFYNLQSLRLQNNQFTGSIPNEIRSIQRLESLDLSGNKFSGSIPPDFGTKKLFAVDLSSNELTGSIPALFHVSAPSLSFLNLANNKLSGTIPSQLALITNLGLLNLAWNRFTGTIPSELGNLFFLTQLSLNDNLLHGRIPIELTLPFLGTLHLQNNQLSGALPPFYNFFGAQFHVMGTNKLCPCDDYSTLGFESNDYVDTSNCNVCNEFSCLNGGICSATDSEFTCDCAGLDFEGPQCDQPKCNPPCQNGGRCVAPNVCDCGDLGTSGKRIIFTGPTCEILPRCPPVAENNATWDTSLPPDNRIGVCQPGFSGRPYRQCRADGTWGPIFDDCTQISTCPQDTHANAQWPETPSNGFATGTCAPGYTGNPRRLCKSTNQWESNIFQPCIRNSCPQEQIGNTLFPKAVSFQVQAGICQPGTKGRVFRTCQADGSWSPPTGTLCA